MAIYEYYCPTCRETFERRRPMSEATAATKCAAGHRADRAISRFAVAAAGDAVAQLESGFDGAGGCACGGGGCGCSAS